MRAVIEHNLIHTDPALKVYAIGPMFRRERPQKGRYRQFHQVDVEAFGFTSPTVDAEMIELALGLPRRLRGAAARARAELGRRPRPAGPPTSRRSARRSGTGRRSMCPDSRRRTETNPLRVLDCKVPEDQEIDRRAPPDHGPPVRRSARDHFAEVRRQLELLGISYRLSHRLVRGLDYYVRTTFEVTSGALGAQSSVLGGRALRRPGEGAAAGRIPPASASRWGWSGWYSSCPRARSGAALRRLPHAPRDGRARPGPAACSASCGRRRSRPCSTPRAAASSRG